MSITKKQLVRIVILLILIACIAVAAWFAFQHFNKKSSTKQPKDGSHKVTQAQKEALHTKLFGNKIVVLINESIFGPKEVTIPANSAVEWTNMEATAHQIVTDDGASITADKSPALAQGQSYQFTFTKKGTFKYHDNLRPSMQGTVTVE